MIYPSIRIEGAILSPDILGRLEDLPGQKPADFGLDSSIKVKDEIVRAWADAQDFWRIFQRKLDSLRPESPATSETRQLWMVPLLALLGYQVEFQVRGAELNGKIYAISHRAVNRALAPVQIVGYREPAGLDRKPDNATLRMSAHAIVQEFINLNEQLYGLVTNGRVLRLLRNSSRLIKLSYLEFDLDRIFTDGLYADFAVLYRLLHATRLPLSDETSKESWIERYHQDSIESGARIRDGLSSAVEAAIRAFGTGFLNHPANTALHDAAVHGGLRPSEYYNNLLRLIYRLLFLMVIEERDLVFPPAATKKQRDIYRLYYSVQRLRQLSEHRHLADPRRHDMWLALLSTFRLFEADGPGEKLGISPLAGDLFGNQAIPLLVQCTLGNDVLLGCLRALNVYEHPENHQLIRVNYAALNVEEFGSVYEGLLEYEPVFINHGNTIEFSFAQGDERAATGSHYTPDDLVQPLIKHSLDYLIAERLKSPNPEAALLDLRVADIACGSGHILLAAARRIAQELAIVRTGEEQPSPPAFRAALRDAIRNCIYGVDLNPQAVELCKVALWLEAHNPGQPLNFLDHHIKCGNAIVGFVRQEELDKGVPDEAFATMPGDEKEVVAIWRKTNKQDRKDIRQRRLAPAIQQRLEGTLKRWNELSALPERTPAEIETKKEKFLAFIDGPDASQLAQIAAIPIAQFYIPKTTDNDPLLISDATFRRYWSDGLTPQGIATAKAWGVAIEMRFFHWFLEFPNIIARGGFDCILGNPPFLGNRALSGTFGDCFLNWVKTEYAPAGAVDLVTYFFRRIFDLLREGGFQALISTNTIAQGGAREGGLNVILERGGTIAFAIRSVRWPGRAAVEVALISIHKGAWGGPFFIGQRKVEHITAYLDDAEALPDPIQLTSNANKSFQGSIVLGKGFVVQTEEAEALLTQNPTLGDVLLPYLNGAELNSSPDQCANRYVVNFFEWSEDHCRHTYPEAFDILERLVRDERLSKSEEVASAPWWQFWRVRNDMYSAIRGLSRVLIIARESNTFGFTFAPPHQVFDAKIIVIATDRSSDFAIVQSNIHHSWARRYTTTLKADLSYINSQIFETFPFPPENQTARAELEAIGEHYHQSRRQLMSKLQIGLTKLYNLFHEADLSAKLVAKISRQPYATAESACADFIDLRALHSRMDCSVLAAYGWDQARGTTHPISLDHNFYEVDYLPESDRVRYTISPASRKEVLRRLLKLNHERAEAEKAATTPPKPKRNRKLPPPDGQPGLYGEE
jgi:methylase of polypeptide subunit release factors